MLARVLFFGVLKDLVGKPFDEVEVPEGTSLAGVYDRYATQFPRLRDISGSVLAARNQEFADFTAAVHDGDEVAFLPPVSGGCEGERLVELVDGANYLALTRRTIDHRALAKRLIRGDEGALVTFEGTVRNNTSGRHTRFLEYEAYDSLALKTMAKIGREIADGREIGRVAIVHRLGRVLVGEISVVVMVTAPHRHPAFEAALDGIDRLKKTVPIWKKEHFVDGEVWAEGEWDRNAAAQ